jgi:hypothetical protein
MTTRLRVQVRKPAVESLDGFGAADHDCRYVFGRLPRALAPFPFSTRQFARLLILRGRIRAGALADDVCVSGMTQGKC